MLVFLDILCTSLYGGMSFCRCFPSTADARLNDFKITSTKTLVIDQKITFIFAMSMTRCTRYQINDSNDRKWVMACRPAQGGNTGPAHGATLQLARGTCSRILFTRLTGPKHSVDFYRLNGPKHYTKWFFYFSFRVRHHLTLTRRRFRFVFSLNLGDLVWIKRPAVNAYKAQRVYHQQPSIRNKPPFQQTLADRLHIKRLLGLSNEIVQSFFVRRPQ